MSFPNHDWMEDCDGRRCGLKHAPGEHPRWRPVKGKPGIYKHDDDGCEIEVIPYHCPGCNEAQITFHAVCGCDRHDTATAKARAEHSRHHCGLKLTKLSLDKRGNPRWPEALLLKHS